MMCKNPPVPALMTVELFGTYRVLRRPDGELWELDRAHGWATFKAIEVNLELSVALTVADVGLLATDERIAAFMRRSRELMRAERPGVARIVYAGQMGGQCFYATQLPKGEPLDKYVEREGPLPWAAAVRLMMEVTDALEAANQCDVLHAGLIPQRVMIHQATERPSVPEVKIVGFDLFCATRPLPPSQATERLSIDFTTARSLGELLQLMLNGNMQQVASEPFFRDIRRVASIPSPVQIILDRLLADAVQQPPYTFGTLRTALHDTFLEPPRIIPGDDPGTKIGTTQQTSVEQHRANGALSQSDNSGQQRRNDDEISTPAPLDDNIQFTAYRPKVVAPGKWVTMLVFTHLDDRPSWMDEDERAPIEEMQAQARQMLGDRVGEYRDSTSDSSLAIPRDGEISLVPEIDGFECNPPRRTFLWKDGVAVHSETFSLRASSALNGKVARGRLTIFLGHLILAEISLSIRVDAGHVPQRAIHGADAPSRAQSSARPFRRIFASYSHDDTAVVETIERHARTLGDEYLRDWGNLRSGELWNERLLSMIEEADVFQLFWSKHASESRYVSQEWQHALQLGRPAFVRPTYWEIPMPKPPAELSGIHFHRLTAAPAEVAKDSPLFAGAAPPYESVVPPAVSIPPITITAPPAPARPVPHIGEPHREFAPTVGSGTPAKSGGNALVFIVVVCAFLVGIAAYIFS